MGRKRGHERDERGNCTVRDIVKADAQKQTQRSIVEQVYSVTKTVAVKRSGVKWRESENDYTHTGKSDSLSPPDKSPLDKCGQAGEEPSFSSDGVQDSDKDEALLGEMGE